MLETKNSTPSEKRRAYAYDAQCEIQDAVEAWFSSRENGGETHVDGFKPDVGGAQ